MVNRWTNVPGELYVEIVQEDGQPVDASQGTRLPQELNQFLDDECTGELTIHFVSNGYNDPGQRYGGPHGLGYPPEQDDERTIDYAEVDGVKLPESLAQTLFDLYTEQINEVHLEK